MHRRRWPPRDGARLLLAAVAGLLALGAAAGPAAKLPLRNLLVEVRQGDAATFDGTAAVLDGAVTVGPNGEAVARPSVSVGTRTQQALGHAVQQFSVLNGAQGIVQLGATVPMTWLEVVVTPQGIEPVATHSLVDTGRRVAVRPSWPGGSAPVTVDVQTQEAALSGNTLTARGARAGLSETELPPDGTVERSSLLTTVQLPLGVWVTVASDATVPAAADSGSTSTRDVAQAQRHVVQMRITAP